MPLASSRAVVGATLLLLVIVAGYFGLYASCLDFLTSLETLRFEAEAANFTGGRVAEEPPGSGRRVVWLEGGGTGSLGFDGELPHAQGSVRAVFSLALGGEPGEIELSIKERGGREPLASRRLTVDAATRRVAVETDLGAGIKRLEFWLRHLGTGRLGVDGLVVERPDGRARRLRNLLVLALRHPGWPHGPAGAPGPLAFYRLPELYERAALAQLAQRVVDGGRGTARQAERLFAWLHPRLGSFPGREACPDLGGSPWQILVRGAGQCDEQARLLGVLLGALGVASRITCAAFAPVQEGEHCFLEAAVEGRWTFWDPYYGLVYGPPGRRAALAALAGDGSLLAQNPDWAAAGPDQRAALGALYHNRPYTLAENRPWPSRYLAEPGPARRFWARRLQDYYLAHLSAADPQDLALARARNYHLFGRLDAAETAYGEARDLARDRRHQRAVVLYRAWLARDRGDDPEACRRLKELGRDDDGDLWADHAQSLAELAGCPAP